MNAAQLFENNPILKIPMSIEQLVDVKWITIKHTRNQLLATSDWTQANDAVLTPAERTAWQDYRQTLRDIPQDFINPDLVTFPRNPK